MAYNPQPAPQDLPYEQVDEEMRECLEHVAVGLNASYVVQFPQEPSDRTQIWDPAVRLAWSFHRRFSITHLF